MIWIIFIVIWILLGIFAFYLEVKNTTKEQMLAFYGDRLGELFIVFLVYCLMGAIFLMFFLLDHTKDK